MMPTTADRYVHEPLDTEVTAVAGHYVLTREERLDFRGRQLLYVLGHAIFDTSCCGMGGCGYALVPGYVLAWHAGTDEGGLPVTLVQPIRDPDERVAVTTLIRDRESISQVQFS
jgi:hypothetical protein